MQAQYFPLEIKGKYYLRHHDIYKPSAILFVAYIGRRQLRYYTGVKVYPDQWNHKRQCAYVSPILSDVDNFNNVIVNKTIETLNQRFSEFKSYLCNSTQNIDIISLLKSTLKGMARKKKNDNKFDNIIDTIRRAVINDTTINTSTEKNYTQKGLPALKYYLDYLESEKNDKIDDFHAFTTEFFNAFALHILNNYTKPDGEPYTISTVNSILKYAKSAVVLAARAGLYLTELEISAIKLRQFDDKSSDNNIALRDDEVMALYRYQCENKTDEIVRDLFLLECTLGHRIADILRIDERVDEIAGKYYISIAPKKTPNKKVEVDIIFNIAKQILIDKYHCTLPECTKDVMNRNIKRIAKNAGINGVELQSIHFAGESQPTEFKKQRYELIATHTGRRTFISMLSARDWSYEKISKYTGQTIEMVEHYDKSTAKYIDIYRQNLRKNPADIVKMSVDTDTENKVNHNNQQNNTTYYNQPNGLLMELARENERGKIEIEQLKENLGKTVRESEDKLRRLKHSAEVEKQIESIKGKSDKDEVELLKKLMEIGLTYDDYIAMQNYQTEINNEVSKADEQHDTLIDD